MTVRVLLVDDHNLFRRGLKALLEQDERFEVIAEAGDIGEALRCVQHRQPDVILLDNHLPGVHGVHALPALHQAAPGARILMLTVSEDEEDLAAALRAGATGYLLKTMEGDALTVEMLHNILKDRRGLVRLITLPSGDVYKDYDSISFAKMTEPERMEFIDWSLQTLSKWLGVDVTTLRQEAEQAA